MVCLRKAELASMYGWSGRLPTINCMLGRMSGIILAIHGGAGAIERGRRDPACEEACREALRATLVAAYQVLRWGGSALDAVELAVKRLEDCEEFNAGRGSVLTALGKVEMDAAIMEGASRRAGAVAGVRYIKNPVGAARAVMEHSPHVLLIGEGADAFSRARGVAMADSGYFITPRRREQLARSRTGGHVSLDPESNKHGTVGAVARDAKGHLAAATSTGGIANKLPGRVGDSALIGAGTWADNMTCAVSATGHGEALMRTAFGHEVDALLRYAGLDLYTACKTALDQVQGLGFGGGCIAVDAAGTVALPFTTQGMYRGWIGADGKPHVATFAEEAPDTIR